MQAGRPHNSITPVWRNKAAIKVRIYRWMECDSATKIGCARTMKISRTTVIKWWDTMCWTKEDKERYKSIRRWVISKYGAPCQYVPEVCAKDLGYELDKVKLDMEMLKMEPKYILP